MQDILSPDIILLGRRVLLKTNHSQEVYITGKKDIYYGFSDVVKKREKKTIKERILSGTEEQRQCIATES